MPKIPLRPMFSKNIRGEHVVGKDIDVERIIHHPKAESNRGCMYLHSLYPFIVATKDGKPEFRPEFLPFMLQIRALETRTRDWRALGQVLKRAGDDRRVGNIIVRILQNL